MKSKNKFDDLDVFSSKCNISAFKREFNNLPPTLQVSYGKKLIKENKPFKETPNLASAFKRGLYILDKEIYNKIYNNNKNEEPLSMKLLDLENHLTGVMMSILDDDELLKKIAIIISLRDDEIQIMEFVKKIDDDLYKKILTKLPDAKKTTEGVRPISNKNRQPEYNDDHHNDEDDDDNGLENNPFAGEKDENYYLLQSQYDFKAESLSIYYEELKKRNLPSQVIESLIMMESSVLDSLVGRS